MGVCLETHDETPENIQPKIGIQARAKKPRPISDSEARMSKFNLLLRCLQSEIIMITMGFSSVQGVGTADP